ncbi:hypothetical protein NPIL_179311 [Nephila pilipes]|uniref:Uncharacterized protein n=1 Tax=Nephila pilipes TaxID=299642 RepID=A0A8X6TEB2_NEPPI|nr:hypothetical protein NPIL_179311 [Nephila pilipes]
MFSRNKNLFTRLQFFARRKPTGLYCFEEDPPPFEELQNTSRTIVCEPNYKTQKNNSEDDKCRATDVTFSENDESLTILGIAGPLNCFSNCSSKVTTEGEEDHPIWHTQRDRARRETRSSTCPSPRPNSEGQKLSGKKKE